MPKKFSLLSWNVEHFRLPSKDEDSIIGHIQKFDPDIIAIYEVEGKDVYEYMVSSFPSYNFHITEGPQTQEILVGVRGTFTAFYTQRIEFRTGNEMLRPGALLSLHIENKDYCLLFLHTRSFPAPIGFGTRDSQFTHAFNLKKKLDSLAVDGKGKFIIVGDLNTMGMDYPFDKDIDPAIELKKLERDAGKVHMRILVKDYQYTWTDGKRKSNLDHVIASEDMTFKKWNSTADVKVSGWRSFTELKSEDKFKNFIRTISDHNSLYFEVL